MVEDEPERLREAETRKLAMPGRDGPFSGRTVEGEYWGQDIHKYGKEGPEDVAIYGTDVAKKWFKTDFKIAYKMNHDRVIAVTGREGFGKSTLALQLALIANPDLTIDDIIFDRGTLEERLRGAEVGETIVVDEAGISMFAQEWWDKVQRQVIKRLVAGRIKRLRIFFVAPHLNSLNNRIRNRRLDMWLYTMSVGRYGRGEAQLKEPLENKYTPSIYWVPRLTMKFDKLEGGLWDEYAEKKNDFVNTVWEGAEEEHSEMIERLKVIWKMSKEDKTSREIADYLTISPSTIRNHQAKLRDNETLREKVMEA